MWLGSDIEPGSGWVGSAYVGTWLYSYLALRALGGPLLSGEREAASRHSANIEFLRTEKVLAQLSAESRVQGAKYRVPRKYLCNREQSTKYKEPSTGHGGLTEAEIIEVALAAKKVFIHRRA